jgi:hypothetical protein
VQCYTILQSSNETALDSVLSHLSTQKNLICYFCLITGDISATNTAERVLVCVGGGGGKLSDLVSMNSIFEMQMNILDCHTVYHCQDSIVFDDQNNHCSVSWQFVV